MISIKDEIAVLEYGKTYDELNDEQRAEIDVMIADQEEAFDEEFGSFDSEEEDLY